MISRCSFNSHHGGSSFHSANVGFSKGKQREILYNFLVCLYNDCLKLHINKKENREYKTKKTKLRRKTIKCILRQINYENC